MGAEGDRHEPWLQVDLSSGPEPHASLTFMQDAEARGCRALDGLGMLVNQGVVGIHYWTGLAPDPTVMRKALESALGL